MGGNINIKNRNNKSPLDVAKKCRQRKISKYLEEAINNLKG